MIIIMAIIKEYSIYNKYTHIDQNNKLFQTPQFITMLLFPISALFGNNYTSHTYSSFYETIWNIMYRGYQKV